MLPVSSTDRVFVLAGAGVSAESGIPTFRGVGGLWRNYRIEEVALPEAWSRDPRLVWEFYSIRRRVAWAAKPNPAHFALAKLEHTLQDRLFVCAQNVDSLHEQAGCRLLFPWIRASIFSTSFGQYLVPSVIGANWFERTRHDSCRSGQKSARRAISAWAP